MKINTHAAANNYGVFVLFIILLIINFSAEATCQFKLGNHMKENTVSIPATLVVQRDAPAGSVIWDSGWVMGGLTSVRCTSTGNTYSSGYVNPITPVSGYQGVYATSNSSIGVRTYFTNAADVATGEVVLYPRATSPISPNDYVPQSNYRVQLISLEELHNGDITINSKANVTYSGMVTNSLNFSRSSLIVNALSCSVNTNNLFVLLDSIYINDLTAIGKTANRKSFTVGLTCDSGARINAQMVGTQNTDTSEKGVLQLTKETSPGVAKGVAIQILYNDAPLALNQNSLLKTSLGGQETFTFYAQYYQTKATVYPGLVNTTATLEITYQ